ncbi:PE-PPE domain-containing protein [Mycobacterium sp. NPDC006124]|uniref:PE-PPE domain-containing protein n=1 Tax=Mycobacterium sp. NPDC006124 TaxID=3156729 RepID=UPI0033A2107A
MAVAVVTLIATVGLAVASAFTAAFAFGAIGLFVPGTGTPDANGVADYLANARDRYTLNTPCNAVANCTPLGIDYPASFFPLVIFPGWCRSGPDGCDKWNDSVGKGTDALDLALTRYLDKNSPEQVTLFGYSQGGAVVSNELQRIAAMRAAGAIDQTVLDRLHVVTIGGIENPDGGLWQRLGFLPTIPFLDISFGPAMKTDNGFDTTAIGFQYDPVTYAPRYWGNPLALLNAVAALETVHGYYLSPNGNGPTDTLPYGYTPPTATDEGTLLPQLDCSATGHPENCRYGSSRETTYIMIPATSLPIFDLVMGAVPAPLKPLVQPLVNLLTPVTKLLIDLGYDWSGDPDKPTPLSILPFNPLTFNPVDFAVKFVQAIGQGVRDAVNGGPSTAFAPVTPSSPVMSTTLASRNVAQLKIATTGDEKVDPTASNTGVDATETQPLGSSEQNGSTSGNAVDPNAAAAADARAAADLKAAAVLEAAADAKAAADAQAATEAAAKAEAEAQAQAEAKAKAEAEAQAAAEAKLKADADAQKAKEAKEAEEQQDATARAAAAKAKEAAENAKAAGAVGAGEPNGTGTTNGADTAAPATGDTTSPSGEKAAA